MLITIYIVIAPGADRPYVMTSPPSREQLAYRAGTRCHSVSVYVPDDIDTEVAHILDEKFDSGTENRSPPSPQSITAAEVLARILAGGREPYAPSIYPLAEMIERRLLKGPR